MVHRTGAGRTVTAERLRRRGERGSRDGNDRRSWELNSWFLGRGARCQSPSPSLAVSLGTQSLGALDTREPFVWVSFCDGISHACARRSCAGLSWADVIRFGHEMGGEIGVGYGRGCSGRRRWG
ncbi:hypothetical protein OH77DRAFT_1226371 [Trametes cingulata]|nr:hypothetical protein OH77DRAFT_1226371 [Trametes cingulata]